MKIHELVEKHSRHDPDREVKIRHLALNEFRNIIAQQDFDVRCANESLNSPIELVPVKPLRIVE